MTVPAEYSFLLLLLSKTTVKKALFHLLNHKYNETICLICAEIHSTSMPAQPTHLSSLSHVFHTYSFNLSNTPQDTSSFDCSAHPTYPAGHTEFIQLGLFIWTPAQPLMIRIDPGSLFFSILAEYLALPAQVEFSNDFRCKRCWEIFALFLSLSFSHCFLFSYKNFLFSFLFK